MRKYLNLAKRVVPELTREAADYIAEEYSKLRNQENLQGDLARVCWMVPHNPYSAHHIIVSME